MRPISRAHKEDKNKKELHYKELLTIMFNVMVQLRCTNMLLRKYLNNFILTFKTNLKSLFSSIQLMKSISSFNILTQ
jgi:hypothetical protein